MPASRKGTSLTLSVSWLDAAGIALALVGFFNLSAPLERFFEGVRDFGRELQRTAKEDIVTHWPPLKHWRYLLWEGISKTAGYIGGAAVFVAMDAKINERWTTYTSLPLWIVIPTFILAILILISGSVIGYFVWGSIWFAVGTSFWRGFQLLGKAPSGIVGSIGLLVTLVSFASAQLAQGA